MIRILLARKFCTLPKPKASEIRQRFIDYFVKENDHTFIKSSSIIPFGDPSLAFVNAGMNQFKPVLLGIKPPPFPRAVNSQKCIRIGGKHNDLEAVGKDGTHHTFFEMLGNWSFGDYFKAEACSLAWKLLTGPFQLNPDELSVTYFGGDENSGLLSDEECKQVWKSIGLKDSQLIPCGMKDNFWEMGPVGPCGPCTEIHLRQPDGTLLELWNLVFIEFERKVDGSLVPLPMKHVDTGMGLERLAKVLQGVPTNYDTDLFTPFFSWIQKISNAPPYEGRFGANSDLDCSYRILADHARAISVALADGMFPDQNHKLRRLIRRFFHIAEHDFKQPGADLLAGLISQTAMELGDIYPELWDNIRRSLHVLACENDAYEAMRYSTSLEWRKVVKENPKLGGLPDDIPGLAKAVTEIKGKTEINAETAFKLYDTYGLETALIEKLSECLKIPLDSTGLQTLLEHQQETSRVHVGSTEQTLVRLKIPETNDSFKYDVPTHGVSCKILAILSPEGHVINVAKKGDTCKIILDKTCLYSEAGGQISDQGQIVTKSATGIIEHAQKLGQFVIHETHITDGEIKTSDDGTININNQIRFQATQHHTATHLLNSALRHLQPATFQRSSHVTSSYLTFDFAINDKEKLDANDITFLENFIVDIINLQLPIHRKLTSINDLPLNTVTIPGENYPTEVYILSIVDHNNQSVSVEPCCGTHCKNTKDIVDFCIVSEKSSGSGVRSLKAFAGDIAVQAKKRAENLLKQMSALETECDDWLNGKENNCVEDLHKIKQQCSRVDLPLLSKLMLMEKWEALDKKVTEKLRRDSKSVLEVEMKKILSTTSSPYVVHVVRGSSPEPVSLVKANTMCLPQRASLIIACDMDNTIRARCAVPKDLVTDNFSAELWMQPVLKVFNVSGSSPKGQDAKYLFNMKPKRVPKTSQSQILSAAVNEAKFFLKSSGRVTK